MRAAYEKMVELDFWNYPGVFEVPRMPPDGWGIVTPASHYHIVVRNAGIEKSVDWLDEIVATSRKADQLQSLFRLIWEMVRSSPEYEQVPERGYGCA
jgi:hypothetical protein